MTVGKSRYVLEIIWASDEMMHPIMPAHKLTDINHVRGGICFARPAVLQKRGSATSGVVLNHTRNTTWVEIWNVEFVYFYKRLRRDVRQFGRRLSRTGFRIKHRSHSLHR